MYNQTDYITMKKALPIDGIQMRRVEEGFRIEFLYGGDVVMWQAMTQPDFNAGEMLTIRGIQGSIAIELTVS